MTFAAAQRTSDILMALAFAQQSLEHLSQSSRGRWRFALQLLLAACVIAGVAPRVVEGVLLLVSLDVIRRFDGPYNGGSDRMRLLVLACLWASHLAPREDWQRIALGYLAVQLLLSYTLAGWVKLVNPDWRSGQALRDIFEFSVYPVSESLRAWAHAPGMLLGLSWTVIAFEVLFPLAMLNGTLLTAALGVAFMFHLSNAGLFGLSRFVWIWVAGYPCLFWFQQEIIGGRLVAP